jgi:glyoxylase-like metal-dependent hydrolase (beta-lactamase superfamily II)/8-oxo-dGTP pyrophosphatase MutT (NUDIX family)
MTPAGRASFRHSAAVVLIRGHGGSLEVFWVRRSDQVTFMPGFRAFVGGTVDPPDAELRMEGAGEGPDHLLRACAVREVFEETGVVVGLAEPAPAGQRAGAGARATARGRVAAGDRAEEGSLSVGPAPDVLREARRRLLAGEVSFSALAREHGWRFRAQALTFAGRWKTPPFAAVRFDTTYFVARVPHGQEPEVRAGELESGEWIAPHRAIERWRAGEVTFAAPILYTLIELARGEEELAERLARAPERAGQPVRRIELKWGIVLQPMRTRPLPPATHTNAYLVGEQEMALIDPGSDDVEELEDLYALIDALAADGRRLQLVLVTHHHSDHVAGVEAVRSRYHVPVGAHLATAPVVGADFTIHDGEEIVLRSGAHSWTLRAIHTPGHARGHLCFLHERTRSLFTGDHITGGTGTVIIDPPEGDMAAYIASLERLLREPIETLFPGHGSPQGAASRRIRWLIDHRREREAKVRAALGHEPLPLADLVERAYQDTPRELWRYAERSLLAHLIKLEAEGGTVREGERWRKSEKSKP